jgi:DNA-binding transcriptional LysR family regulator
VSLSALDLNLLLVLDAVLAERSVARAAERLHVTPSAISNALARLRAALGDPLVARKGRGIVPTPRALELAPIIARALADIDAAVHGGAFDAATTTRTFTLAIADVGQVVLVPPLAAAMAVEMPAASLRIIGIDSLVALGGVAGSEVDLALGVAPRAPGIHKERLFDEPITLVARADHPAAKHRTQLESLRHVAVEMVPSKGFHDLVASAYARAGIARRVVMSMPTFTAAAAVVVATDYVTSLPASLLEHYGPRMGLRVVLGPVPAHTVPMELSWHERTHSDVALIAFRELVRRVVSKAGRSGGSAPRRSSRKRRMR